MSYRIEIRKTNLQPPFEDISPKPLNKCLQSATAVLQQKVIYRNLGLIVDFDSRFEQKLPAKVVKVFSVSCSAD